RWKSCGTGRWRRSRGPAIAREILEFIENHRVLSVAMTDAIIGCPHQEGIDYEGEWCLVCDFWHGRDRLTDKKSIDSSLSGGPRRSSRLSDSQAGGIVHLEESCAAMAPSGQTTAVPGSRRRRIRYRACRQHAIILSLCGDPGLRTALKPALWSRRMT